MHSNISNGKVGKKRVHGGSASVGRALSVLGARLNNQTNIEEMAKERKDEQHMKALYPDCEQEVGSQVLERNRAEHMSSVDLRRRQYDHEGDDMTLQILDPELYSVHEEFNQRERDLKSILLQGCQVSVLEKYKSEGIEFSEKFLNSLKRE